MYAIVIGLCSPSLQSRIEGDSGYISKSKVFGVIWLLKKAKKITAGVDTKANPALTLHEHMMAFFTMRQEWTEADDENRSRFNSRPQNMEMAGGENLLCSPQLMEKY